MDLFTVHFNYELVHVGKLVTENKPTWFCYNSHSCVQNYKDKNPSGLISKFTPKSSLQLIDINHKIFHLDFLSRLNNSFPYNANKENVLNKLKISASLGLPNDEIIKKYGFDLVKCDDTIDEAIIDNLEFMESSRQSQINLDRNFVNFLNETYSDYGFDGYISLYPQPSKYHKINRKRSGETWVFPSEICIFRPVEKLNYIGTQKGGDGKDKDKYIKLYIDNNKVDINIGAKC
jgi:hypothetical protein